MKQAIVSGSTGFIGSVFVELLVNKGIDVLALGRQSFSDLSSYKKAKLNGVTYLCLNMDIISSLDHEISALGWDVGDDCVFFNLAWGGVDRLSDLDIEAQMNNVIYSVEALSISAKIGCRRFIQVGTMEEAFTYKYLELNHNVDSQYNRHVIYSVAKISAKHALQLKSQQLGIEYIYVLHSHVMGPEDDKDSFLQVTLKKLIQGEDLVFSSGEQYFDVVSVQDCALGYYLICEKGSPGEEYWVGSGNPCRLREYVERMYSLFPSKKSMQFGKLPYNDVILSPEDFSIENLSEHTGYKPTMSYEQTVINLHEHMFQ
ncbi:MAG: NAD(P)-dependent oxidoreductase [Candidatus Sedimenticola sp. 6PFRAG1]